MKHDPHRIHMSESDIAIIQLDDHDPSSYDKELIENEYKRRIKQEPGQNRHFFHATTQGSDSSTAL